jgi:HEAT repeat protein
VTLAAQDALCRDLSLIGDDVSVPVLRRLLLKPETREPARYALERIPGEASLKALREALRTAEGSAQAGIIGSLGRRKDSASVAALGRLLVSTEATVASASAAALGEIGDSKSLNLLLAATPTPAVSDALLNIAGRLQPADAAPVYHKLYGASQPPFVRAAALRGLARAGGPDTRKTLVAALHDESPDIQAVAIRELATSGFDLGAERKQLPPPAQVRVLAALADRAGQGSLPVFQDAATSDSEPVRIAALRGLGVVGGAASVDLLAERAANTTGEEQEAARASLSRLRGAGVDEAILHAIPAAPAKTKVELIRATGERGSSGASDVLLKTAVDADRGVRRESIRALRETAGPPAVPALVALLVAAQDANDRKEYERTVAAAIRRSKEAPVAEVLAAYGAAADNAARTSLLSVLSMVGNPQALPVLRQALKADQSDIRRTAINALAEWPSAEPAPDLLALAQSSSDLTQHVLSLRAYVKLVQIPSDRSPAETAGMLAAAMAAAKRADERKLVLGAAARVICEESLAMAKAAAADPAVAGEAKLAIQTLERGLSYRK